VVNGWPSTDDAHARVNAARGEAVNKKSVRKALNNLASKAKVESRDSKRHKQRKQWRAKT
jgi:hypothetical protein